MKTRSGSRSRAPNNEKESRIRMGECVATSCSALLQEIQEKKFPPKKWLVFRVLELKTREKWRRSCEAEDGGGRTLYL
jgi:hypothetical protein